MPVCTGYNSILGGVISRLAVDVIRVTESEVEEKHSPPHPPKEEKEGRERRRESERGEGGGHSLLEYFPMLVKVKVYRCH